MIVISVGLSDSLPCPRSRVFIARTGRFPPTHRRILPRALMTLRATINFELVEPVDEAATPVPPVRDDGALHVRVVLVE